MRYALILFLATGLSWTLRAAEAASDRLHKVLDQYMEERLKLFPFEATSIGDPRYNDQFPNSLSDSYRGQQHAFYQKYLAQLGQFHRDSLPQSDQLSFDVLKREMTLGLQEMSLLQGNGGYPVMRHMTINQFASFPIDFVLYGSGQNKQPFKTVKDYENWLKRMEGFPRWADSAISDMKAGLKARVTPARVLMVSVVQQLDEVANSGAGSGVLYQPLREFPAGIPASERERLKTAYTRALEKKVLPAFRKLRNFVQNEYLPNCTSTAGISALPGGRDAYLMLVKHWTTTDTSPDDIHALGLREVARIRAEMEKAKSDAGFKGSLKEFFDYLRKDPKFYPFKNDEEVLSHYRGIETRIAPRLKDLFGVTPKSRFEIRATEKFRAATSSAEYMEPSEDGSRPGIFYVPIPNAKEFSPVRSESLFLHEAIPGHHYQISLQQENKEIPKFRRFLWYGAFGEGWALYTESLGKELGVYTDPIQYFGMLSAEMHRAIRLVVDTGIHWKGWTREQAIRYSLENEGMSEAGVIAEIERYMAIPGQALSYKMGQLKILELREKAKRELGAKFSLRNYHDEVLKDGVLPLDVFERKMDRWIAAQKK